MESQSVSLLTEGYLRGWLDFDYKTPFSRTREAFILRYLEREKLQKVVEARMAYLTAASSARSSQALKEMSDTYKTYFDLALPYLSDKAKIGKTELTKETLAALKKVLQDAKNQQSKGQSGKMKVNK